MGKKANWINFFNQKCELCCLHLDVLQTKKNKRKNKRWLNFKNEVKGDNNKECDSKGLSYKLKKWGRGPGVESYIYCPGNAASMK